MFTDYFKIVCSQCGNNTTSGSSSFIGYFVGLNKDTAINIFTNTKDIYGNYLDNYEFFNQGIFQTFNKATKYMYPGDTLDLNQTYKNPTGRSTSAAYYDLDNEVVVESNSGLSNYLRLVSNYSYISNQPYGIGTATSSTKDKDLIPLYDDCIAFKNTVDGIATTGRYIMIGTGNTPNTSSTYKLDSLVSIFDCSIVCDTSEVSGYTITITNKKNENLVVKEIGIATPARLASDYYNLHNSNTSGSADEIALAYNLFNNTNKITSAALQEYGLKNTIGVNSFSSSYSYIYGAPVLLWREVLETPVTIPPKGRIVLTLDFSLDLT